jgi:heme/copper-type cytochrome/quinol oxidase subunit 4
MSAVSASDNVIRKYLPVYFVLIAIFLLELFLSFRISTTSTLVVVLLLLAICSATLGLLYFMHLAQERRGLLLTLIPVTIFVLLMMNMWWSDGVRLLHMRPMGQ